MRRHREEAGSRCLSHTVVVLVESVCAAHKRVTFLQAMLAWASDHVEKTVGTEGPEVAASIAELLAAAGDQTAGCRRCPARCQSPTS